jgi:hypothetical protein
MIFRKAVLAAGLLAAACCLASCTTIASWTAGVAQHLSSSTPSQVSTYADAVLAADTVTRLADVAVQSGKLSVAQLQEIGAINEQVHSAFLRLKAANAAGQSLDFAALNTALQLWTSYTTAQGIAH